MNTKIHLPTGDFAFIEQELFCTPEEAVEAFKALQRAYKPEAGEGLTPKEWNTVLDGYLNEGTMNADIYASMNAQQQFVIQEIKKSSKRVNK